MLFILPVIILSASLLLLTPSLHYSPSSSTHSSLDHPPLSSRSMHVLPSFPCSSSSLRAWFLFFSFPCVPAVFFDGSSSFLHSFLLLPFYVSSLWSSSSSIFLFLFTIPRSFFVPPFPSRSPHDPLIHLRVFLPSSYSRESSQSSLRQRADFTVICKRPNQKVLKGMAVQIIYMFFYL